MSRANKFLWLLAYVPLLCGAQQMFTRQFNFRSFPEPEYRNSALWQQLNSERARQHPEYGLLPRDAKCVECVEVIDKRTEYSRYYVLEKQPNHFQVQQSYFPLHYRNEAGEWITIDPRLKPAGNQVYRAGQQPIPTVCDLQMRQTRMELEGLDLIWNNGLRLYLTNENLEPITHAAPTDYSHYTIGEDGMRVYGLWQGVDMEQYFQPGAVKTDFILTRRPAADIPRGYWVIEDHLPLPPGYSIVPSVNGTRFSGVDLEVRNPQGEVVATIAHPACRDANEIGFTGKYHITHTGNLVTLRLLVDIAWLQDPRTAYPVVIDPLVTGIKKRGNFISSGLPQENMQFTSLTLGACPHKMYVPVPGKSTLVKAYFDVEDQTTSDPDCGVPLGQLGHICLKREILHTLRSDTCNVSVGPFYCAGVGSGVPNNCDTPGVITTDPNTVPGAARIPINNNNFLGCIPPQCPDYDIPFTLLNQDSSCGDVCGYLCARTNMWQMTIEACMLEGYITQNKTVICPGEPVTFTAHPSCGVPPYHFIWDYNNSQILDTVYVTPTFTINPTQSGDMFCYIVDACGVIVPAGPLTVTVTPAPPADAGPNHTLCLEGGTITLGGNPTTSPNASVVWAGENATVTGYLNATNIPNPTATVPGGVTDTFYYTVTAQQPGFNCNRTDTVYVFVRNNPTVTLDTTGVTEFCAGGSVTLTAAGNFSSYQWSHGPTTKTVTITQPGQYSVIVTDAFGCKDTSHIVTVQTISVPSVTVYPDTLIMYGDSVMLSTNLNLLSANIDSFIWQPNLQISCTTCTNPYVSPLSDQYYGIRVYADGCVVSDSALIRLILPNNFFIPNAFTPNGDGNNDFFYIYAQSGVKVLEFQIYNRIGEKVHAGAFPWDGNYKGKPSPPGVYVYVFKLGLFGDERSIMRKGSVTLIR
ncbi:MAG: gliding motility-associated C-terminal domain-containing protein [Chitinophagales bacterium]|nr:gliding motility-associated C-terminal domain-containing protein [Chitinophagales bacterium]MDW8419815.1 gliding motility-associated C-terminal domain-containing protein [Chitinophagales bacterium]